MSENPPAKSNPVKKQQVSKRSRPSAPVHLHKLIKKPEPIPVTFDQFQAVITRKASCFTIVDCCFFFLVDLFSTRHVDKSRGELFQSAGEQHDHWKQYSVENRPSIESVGSSQFRWKQSKRLTDGQPRTWPCSTQIVAQCHRETLSIQYQRKNIGIERDGRR